MDNRYTLMLASAVFALASTPMAAQQAPSSFAGSLVRSSGNAASTAAASQSISASTEVLIANRARVFGDAVSANGTRYFYLSDTVLRGKTPDDLLQTLSPTVIKPGDHVRDIEIVVDLMHPLKLYAKSDQPINVGTAIVQGLGLNNVEVHSAVITNGLTVLPK